MRSFPYWVCLALVSVGHLFIENSEAQTPAPTPPLRSPLQVLAAEGPNASHWAVAPLEQPLAPNIRQNLTFLKEDLIDEAKTKPVGTPVAYNAAYRLCVGLIAALDERDLALAHAGLRSAQANNNQVLTSQSLEARRNYMFSWPQYARTLDERAALEKQGTNNVKVANEQLRVEWAQRGAVLAKTFDSMYSQFREALRQTPALLVPQAEAGVRGTALGIATPPASPQSDTAPLGSASDPKAAATSLGIDPGIPVPSAPKNLERLFVGKTWITPTGTKFTFEKEGMGHRRFGNDQTSFVWHLIGADTVEATGQRSGGGRVGNWYFRFISAQEALYGDSAETTNAKLKLASGYPTQRE